MTLTELKYIVAVIFRRAGRGALLGGDRPRREIVATAQAYPEGKAFA